MTLAVFQQKSVALHWSKLGVNRSESGLWLFMLCAGSTLSEFVSSHMRLCEHKYIAHMGHLGLSTRSVSWDGELQGDAGILCAARWFWGGFNSLLSIQPVGLHAAPKGESPGKEQSKHTVRASSQDRHVTAYCWQACPNLSIPR